MNNKIYFIDKVDLLPIALITLIPFFLITGSFLADLAISICSIFFLIFKKNFLLDDSKKRFIFFFLIFNILIFISSLASKDFESIFKSIVYIRFLFFTLLFWFMLDKYNTDFLKINFFTIFFLLISLIVDGFFQFFFKQNLFGLPIIEGRISSFFGDELIMGSYVSKILIIFISLNFLFFLKNKFYNLLVYSTIILSISLIFISGERSSFFLIILFMILLSVFIKVENLKYFFLITISILTIYFSTLLNSQPTGRMLHSTYHQLNLKFEIDDNLKLKFSKVDEQKKIFIFSYQHETIYLTALKMFNSYPLTGVGIKNFRSKCEYETFYINSYSCNTHPHNYYIQLLSETGLFSFLFIVLIYLFISIRLFKNFILIIFNSAPILNNLQVSILLYYFIFLFPFIPTGSFFNNWISIALYFPLAIMLYVNKNIKNKKNIKIDL